MSIALDEPLARARHESGVPRGRVVVGDHEGRVLGPANGDLCLAESEPGAGERSLGDEQMMCGPTSLHLGRSATRRDGQPPWRGDESTRPGAHEKIATDHPDHREDEDPQEDEEPVPGNGDDDFGQGS